MARCCLIVTREVIDLARTRALISENVKRVTTKSVTSEEIERQRSALATAERKLTIKKERLGQMREKIAVLRHELSERRAAHRQNETTDTARTVTAGVENLETAAQLRDEMLVDYRELKQIVRDQQTICRQLEKREEAKQKAVAKFIREWEQNYDRALRLKARNVNQRRQATYS